MPGVCSPLERRQYGWPDSLGARTGRLDAPSSSARRRLRWRFEKPDQLADSVVSMLRMPEG
jgi:hypothetical protein